MKVGIIGYGHMGRLHHLKLKELGIDDICVLDIREENLKLAKKEGAKPVDSVEDLSKCDKIIIATPTNTHYNIIKKIANVFKIEKKEE